MRVANNIFGHGSVARRRRSDMGGGRGSRAPFRPLIALVLVAAAFGACAKSGPAPEAPAAAESGTPSGTAQAGGAAAALVLRVAYTEGLVERLGSGAVAALLGPGDLLFPGDTLRTGKDGRCDLEIEGLGSIRLLADSLLRLEAADILGSGPRFAAELQAGRVLAKARKLAGGEAFMLRTKHAICGVRGTAFALEFREGRSLLAVEEGRVAVLPQGPVLRRVEDAAATSQAARGLLRALVALAPLVGAGEEYALDPAAAATAEAAYEGLAAALPAAAAGAPSLPPEALIPAESLAPATGEAATGDAAAAGAAMEPTLRERLKAALPAPRPAGPESKSLREALQAFSGARGAGPSPGAVAAGPASGPASETAAVPASGAPPAAPQAPGARARNPALLGASSLFAGMAVANLQSAAGELVIGADGKGAFVAFDAAGGRRWSVELAGASAALRSKEKVYLAGEAAFVVLDAATGRELARGPGLPAGARLAAFPDGCLAATAVGVLRYPDGGAESVKEYPLAGGALAAANFEGKILAAPGKGGLVLLDAETGAVLAAASSPASPHFRLYGSGVALAGPAAGGSDSRGGNLVVLDLPGLGPRWEAPLAFRPAAEPEFNKEGVFVWGRGSLAGFSPEGRPLGQVEGVVAPPLLSRGVLYYGTKDGDFIAASPLDLKTRSVLRLPSPLAGRPIAVGEELRLPLRDGGVARLDPRLFK